MAQPKEGDKVKVHYIGKYEDDEVFDSSENREPLEFTIGSGSVIAGFEKGVMGMEVGEKKTITIPPEEAYGPKRKELVRTFEMSQLPKDILPWVGKKLNFPRPDGRVIQAVVTHMDDDTVTLDANHDLAGKTLIFDLQLVEIG